MMGPSDVVYVEKGRGPRTDPWGTPVTSWCALDTPGHLERSTSEIGFKPAKWNPSDVQEMIADGGFGFHAKEK